jgi:hypothetical protein
VRDASKRYKSTVVHQIGAAEGDWKSNGVKTPLAPPVPPPRPSPPTRTPVRDAGTSIFFSWHLGLRPRCRPRNLFRCLKSLRWIDRTPPRGPRRPPRPCDKPVALVKRDTPKFFRAARPSASPRSHPPYYHPQWCKQMAGPPWGKNPPPIFFAKNRSKCPKNTSVIKQGLTHKYIGAVHGSSFSVLEVFSGSIAPPSSPRRPPRPCDTPDRSR